MSETELLEKVQAITLLIEVAKNKGESIAYLSGKVTGLLTLDVTKKFAKDAELLRLNGYFVFNPTEWIDADCHWQTAMRLCLAILPLCPVLYMQDDWFDSEGAFWEVSTARRLGHKILTL
ncbi:DUF4406 domain-containing protein [Pedobacter arcticus]|uniref:DUF4406 domain-containing protein n=1 Tax=Pedobacter arcticus TaxID=752140 RepID=UPI0002DED2ED|nr:DUF4406 domain-containing protein [Pedobacter arcticus]